MAFTNPPKTSASDYGNDHHTCYHNMEGFGKKIIVTLLGVLLVYLVFYVGTLTRNTIKKYDSIGMADQMERTITVTGYGKVVGTNDIAVTSIGYSNTDKDVAKAQMDNKKVMDGVTAELKKMGIEDKDLQTSYSIYPQYNYTQQKGQEFKGYQVNNSVTIKIHDLSKISAILSLPGKYGATQVGELTFTIDDIENLKNAAREKALADVNVKAVELAKSLGVRLVEVIAYSDYESGQENPGPYPAMRVESTGLGTGGGGPEVVETGSKDVIMNVNVTYKIVPRYW